MRHKGANVVLLTSGIVASLVLAFFIAPVSAYAEDIGTITKVDYAGVEITLDRVVKKSDLLSETQYWNANFAWPEPVFFGTGRTFVGVFRGRFGNLDGGTLQPGVNYAYQKPGFSAGMQSLGANYSLPALLNPLTQSGQYTILVAEYPFSNYNDTTLLNWFAQGGAPGTKEPYRYTALNFTYDATESPVEIPGAIQSVEYAGRSIIQGDEVYRKEIDQSENQYWNFRFQWPNAVQNNKALLMVFKGTFGAVEGGDLAQGVNYGYNLQAWASGSNEFGKFINLPLFRASTTPAGVYTVMVAERSPSSLTQSPDQQALWFATGGAQGAGPAKYSLLTFEYKKYKECCSSVAFIPGLKGSKLAIGSDTIWPPSLFSNDVPQLALTPEGESVNDVKVIGTLDSFYGVPIYSGFETFLEGLKGTVIADWKSLPYDWRYAPDTIVNKGVETPNGVSSMKAEIEKLAEDSDTGKVSIVAHSYGGLIGKQLIKTLIDYDEESLIDSFVMVGSPQLGTPQAIASLLHGDGESIFGGVVVNKSASRTVAQNMPSTYLLLPSQAYFKKVTDPVITFNESAQFTLDWRNYWGLGINSFLDFFSFATGGGVTRTKPQSFETQKPEILSPTIFAEANTHHATLDTMQFPQNIRVVQIAGWGLPTVKSVEYRNEHFQQSYRTQFTIEGDQTVVYPSAVSGSQLGYFFNLYKYNRIQNVSSVSHTNLLSSTPIQSFLYDLLRFGNIADTEFITSIKPTPDLSNDQITVSTHSPVVLGVYDEFGRFTGIDQSQDLNADFLRVTQDIPGSSFINTGDSQYLFLPENGTYRFVYKGTGTGSTTVELGTLVNDISRATAMFTDIPTTNTTSAIFTINQLNPTETVIAIDTNGDSLPDLNVVSDSKDLSLSEIVAMLKQKVQALQVRDPLKKSILKTIEVLERKIARQKTKKASKIVMNLQTVILRKADKGKVNETDAGEIIRLLELLESKI